MASAIGFCRLRSARRCCLRDTRRRSKSGSSASRPADRASASWCGRGSRCTAAGSRRADRGARLRWSRRRRTSRPRAGSSSVRPAEVSASIVIMPTRNAPVTTGRQPMSFSAMISTASCSVVSGPTHRTGELMHSPTSASRAARAEILAADDPGERAVVEHQQVLDAVLTREPLRGSHDRVRRQRVELGPHDLGDATRSNVFRREVHQAPPPGTMYRHVWKKSGVRRPPPLFPPCGLPRLRGQPPSRRVPSVPTDRQSIAVPRRRARQRAVFDAERPLRRRIT